ncbi:MAG: hypothetical protein KDD69_05700 [Bdellovibrionales bacterium]|nr:hypothetical protein [Bdellovibrionales bacterium]
MTRSSNPSSQSLVTIVAPLLYLLLAIYLLGSGLYWSTEIDQAASRYFECVDLPPYSFYWEIDFLLPSGAAFLCAFLLWRRFYLAWGLAFAFAGACGLKALWQGSQSSDFWVYLAFALSASSVLLNSCSRIYYESRKTGVVWVALTTILLGGILGPGTWFLMAAWFIVTFQEHCHEVLSAATKNETSVADHELREHCATMISDLYRELLQQEK